MAAMMGGERGGAELDEFERAAWGATMLMGFVVKTVSLRPTMIPGPGFCSQPAWRAMRTVLGQYVENQSFHFLETYSWRGSG